MDSERSNRALLTYNKLDTEQGHTRTISAGIGDRKGSTSGYRSKQKLQITKGNDQLNYANSDVVGSPNFERNKEFDNIPLFGSQISALSTKHAVKGMKQTSSVIIFEP